LDKAVVDARAKAAAAAGTTRTPIVPWSIHDLRRTVATGLQRLGFRIEATEAVLAAGPVSRASTTLVRMQEIGRHAYSSTEMTLRLRDALRQ
jgi:hypothetical protein